MTKIDVEGEDRFTSIAEPLLCRTDQTQRRLTVSSTRRPRIKHRHQYNPAIWCRVHVRQQSGFVCAAPCAVDIKFLKDNLICLLEPDHLPFGKK